MKTIAIVSTQLQFINAVEFVKKNGAEKNTLIIDTANKKRTEQLKRIMDLDLYDKAFSDIYYTSITNSKNAYIDTIYTKLLLFALSLLYRYNIIIVGNYTHLKHKYLAQVGLLFKKNAQVVVVDDGTLSFFYPEIRAKEHLTEKCNKSYEKSKFYRFLFCGNFRRVISSKIDFYSLYELKFSTADVVKKNSLAYLSNNLTTIGGGIGFKSFRKIIVGQPLLQLGLVSEKDYINAISRIIGTCDPDKVLYVSHPAEDCYPFSSLGIKIIKFQLPFECLVNLLESSVEIYGFTSSALTNAKLLCPNLQVVAVDIRSVLHDNSNFIEISSKIYSSFKDNGICIMSLN